MAGFWGKKDGAAEALSTDSEVPKNPVPNTTSGSPKPAEILRGKPAEGTVSSRDSEKPSSGIEHFIGVGTKLKANVHFSSNALIDGQLEGDIFCTGTLVIGANGTVVGPVRCASLDVRGKYSGPAKVDKCLSIRSGGTVNGTVESGLFVVEEGGVINGEVKITL